MERKGIESLKSLGNQNTIYDMDYNPGLLIYISYIPDQYIVESKSLKLYLFSYRNHGDFHEDCVNMIMKDLIKLLSPRYIEVWGKFLPRGGLSIDPYCNYGIPGTEWKDFARYRLLNHDLNPENIHNLCGKIINQRPAF